MLLRRTHKVSILRKRETRLMNWSCLQDVLRDPALNPHKVRMRDANGAVLPFWFGNRLGFSSLLNSEDSVCVDRPMHYSFEEFGIHVSKVREVVQSEDHWQIAVNLLDRPGRFQARAYRAL